MTRTLVRGGNNAVTSLPSGGSSEQLQLPDSLLHQLRMFRRQVWCSKLLESTLAAVAVAGSAFLVVYATDRVLDTPRWLRAVMLLLVILAGLTLVRTVYRWVWKLRRIEQLAKLLRQQNPEIGDQLLGVIELVRDPAEQSRSRALCEAAVRQVAERAQQYDLRSDAPRTQIKSLGWIAGAIAVIVLGLWWHYPGAFTNAWLRLVCAHRDIPRYTFVRVMPLPSQWIVPHGETAALVVRLAPQTQSVPPEGHVTLDGVGTIDVPQQRNAFHFSLPPLTAPVMAHVHIGDWFRQVRIVPTLRPELTDVMADVQLPDYLQRAPMEGIDVRSGTLAAVTGSRVVVRGQASRPLRSVSMDDLPLQQVNGARWISPILNVEGETAATYRFTWRDTLGLSGVAPLELKISPQVDEPPSVSAQGLPNQQVVLVSQQLNFKVLASDDFGVRRIGLKWRGLDESLAGASEGERVLAAGSATMTSMEASATFSAANVGIEAQPVELQVWVEDYFPERGRIYSAPHVLYVLTEEQHVVWITEQLNQWQRASLDVRDQELQLFARNTQLRQRVEQEGWSTDLQEAIRRQAALEQANAQRLNQLTRVGADLISQATRNPAVSPERLEEWAGMLNVLNDIGGNRMPSVAQLLQRAARNAAGREAASNRSASLPAANDQETAAADASQAKENGDASGERDPSAGNTSPGESGTRSGGGAQQSAPDVPQAGKNRATDLAGAADDSSAPKLETPQPALPSVSDVESTMQKDALESESGGQKPPSGEPPAPRLGLPGTQLVGPTGAEEEASSDRQNPASKSLSQALFEQEALLAEFERVSDELNQLLANMEGSTLVKRLKAAARQQQQVADRMAARIGRLFGASGVDQAEDQQWLNELVEREESAAETVSYIMDDVQSYYERRRMLYFKQVLDEMREMDVTLALRQLAEDLVVEPGLSIAQAEFWADTLDRWAEDLVPPPDKKQRSSDDEEKPSEAQPPDALPPRLLVEILRILEGEVNLREQTRVAEQARPAVEPSVHLETSIKLSDEQAELRERLGAVVNGLLQLPEGADRFADEIDLLSVVSTVMDEATALLAQSQTGPETIAAETEVIELLLQSDRINPKGAGRGGASPGGGSTGTTETAALALIGSGLNQKAHRESREVTQATGQTGRSLPEEFQAGLDVYFQRIEGVLP